MSNPSRCSSEISASWLAVAALRLSDNIASLASSRSSWSHLGLETRPSYWHAQLGLVLLGQQVPAPPGDRTFQLWVVPKKGNPISAGIFRPNPQGTVLVVTTPEAAIEETAALAISEEPAGGRSQPTKDKILWVGPLT